MTRALPAPARLRARRRRARRAPAAGFTLLELLVVLVILGLLAAIAVPQVVKYLGQSRADAAKIQVQSLGSVLDLYHLDVGRYPTQEEGMAALVSDPGGASRWNGPYVKNPDSLTDPWGNPYLYRFPGEHGPYDLYSLGADGTPGGEGENRDVGNW